MIERRFELKVEFQSQLFYDNTKILSNSGHKCHLELTISLEIELQVGSKPENHSIVILWHLLSFEESHWNAPKVVH